MADTCASKNRHLIHFALLLGERLHPNPLEGGWEFPRRFLKSGITS